MKLIATYAGKSAQGHHILRDVGGDKTRDHVWVNGYYGGFPDDIPTGTRVSFYCSLFPRPGGPKVTEVREVKVL